jgi:hypothetical protein
MLFKIKGELKEAKKLQIFSNLFFSVTEPHHFDAAPAPGRQNDAAQLWNPNQMRIHIRNTASEHYYS